MAGFYTIKDLEHLPEPQWLIDGLFEQDSLVMLVGPPGSFKSFLAIDWALSLAAYRPWNKRAVRPSRVLYALGEGKASLLKRIKAWVHHHQLTREEEERLYQNFKVTFDVPQLGIPHQTREFIDDLKLDEFYPTVLIIDTLARSFVGKDENSQTDAGVWVESADKLRKLDMTVMALHHTRKNVEFGLQYRGSSAFEGAWDTAFTIQRNPDGFKGYAKLFCSKQKDHEEPSDIWMKTERIKPDPRTEGSIVLVETEKPGEAEQELREVEERLLQEIIDGLIIDTSYTSDRARAKVLAEQTGLNENTANTKINRRRTSAKQEKEGRQEPSIHRLLMG